MLNITLKKILLSVFKFFVKILISVLGFGVLALLFYSGIIVKFFIFREEPIGRKFITDINKKKIKCKDVVRMYNKWLKQKEDPNIDIKFKNVFTNIIDLNDSGYHAYYYKQENGVKRDIVVFFHGVQCCIFSDPFIDESKDYCLLNYLKKDFDVLIVEYPGLGINKQGDVDSNFDNMLCNMNEWVEKNYGDKKKILAGHSFGCYLALRCCNLAEFKYDCVIISNPFVNIQSAAEHILKKSKLLYGMTLFIKKKYNCVEEIKKVKNNLVIIKLEKDRICPPKDAVILFENYKKDNEDVKCLLADVENDSNGKVYTHHEFPNIEQLIFFAKYFCEDGFCEKYPSYDKYKTALQSNNMHK